MSVDAPADDLARLRADNHVMALALRGWTPDRNTQTEADASAREDVVEAAVKRALTVPVDGSVEPLADEIDLDTAMNHLGNVLYVLSDLDANHRCKALDDALAFYNAARPDAQVSPTEGFVTYLVHKTPLDALIPTHKGPDQGAISPDTLCTCLSCQDLRRDPGRFVLAGPATPGWSYACHMCGNKRCPHHADHRFVCTRSNASGQVGVLISTVAPSEMI